MVDILSDNFTSEKQSIDILSEEFIPLDTNITPEKQNINFNANLISPDEVPEVTKEITEQQDINEALARKYFSDEELLAFDNNPITFDELDKFIDWEDVTPVAGTAKQAFDYAFLNEIAQGMAEGKEPNQEAIDKLDNFMKLEIEKEKRGFSLGAKIGYIGSAIPAFATDLVLAGGVVASGKKAIKTTVKQAVKKSLGKKIGGTVGTGIATASLMPSTIANYNERRFSDGMTITDKGEAYVRESKESPTKAAFMTLGYQSSEVVSEFVGGKLAGKGLKYLYKSGTKLLPKTPITSAIIEVPQQIQQAIYKGVGKNTGIPPKLSKLFSKVGYDGLLEIPEEEFANILNAGVALTGGDVDADGAINIIKGNLQDRLAIAGLAGIGGVVSASSAVVENSLSKRYGNKKATDITSSLTQSELDNYADKELPAPTTDYDSTVIGDSVQATNMNNLLDTESLEDAPFVLEQESPFIKSTKDFLKQTRYELLDDKGNIRDLSSDVSESLDFIGGLSGFSSANLQVGVLERQEDGSNKVIGKSLKAVVEDWSNKIIPIEGNLETRLQDMNDYLVSRRLLLDAESRKDITVSQKKLDKANADIQNIKNKYGDDIAWFDTFSEEVYDFQTKILEKLVDAEVLSKTEFNAILKENPHYIPIKKKEVEVDGKKKKKAKKGIKRLGDIQDVEFKNFIESIIGNTHDIIATAETNKRNKLIVDTLVKQGLAEKSDKKTVPIEVDGKTIFRQSRYSEGKLSVFENGKEVFYNVPEDIYNEMKGFDTNVLNWMNHKLNIPFRAAELHTTVFRAFATAFEPAFWVKNWVRDLVAGHVQSKYGISTKNIFKGLDEVIRNGDLYKQFISEGGSFEHTLTQNELSKLDKLSLDYKKLIGEPVTKGNIIKAFKHAGLVSEMSNRMSIYLTALDKGATNIEAISEAKNATLNFTIAGRKAKEINKYKAFFSASIGGTRKTISELINNPKRVAMRAIPTITIPQLIISYYMLYQAPEEDREKYLEIPDWQRAMFSNLVINGKVIPIPRAHLLGSLFGTIPEKAMISGYKGDKPEMRYSVKDMIDEIWSTSSPVADVGGFMPNSVQWAVETMTNYSFFTGNNIYPEWKADLLPQDRYNRSTPEITKKLGEEFNVSPAMIQHGFRSTMAGSAKYAEFLLDYGLKRFEERQGIETAQRAKTVEDLPFVGTFVKEAPTGFKAKSISNFFEDLNEARQAHKSISRAKGEEKAILKEKFRVEDRGFNILNTAAKDISSFNKKIDKINESTTMTNKEKVDAIKPLKERILRKARQANSKYKKIKEEIKK